MMMERYRSTMPSEVKDLWAKDAELRIAELEEGLREALKNCKFSMQLKLQTRLKDLLEK